MTITTAQILGGVFGLSIVWLVNYYFEMRDSKIEEQAKIKHKLELEQIKRDLTQ